MQLAIRALVPAFLLLAACAAPSSSDDDAAAGTSDLVGGSHVTTRTAAGFLVHGDAHVACGATLIAPNVIVTAAHCVGAFPDGWSFGTGDVGTSGLVAVQKVVPHPEFHPKPTGSLGDVHYYLRNNDVAYAVLASPVAGVEPATIASDAPTMGCDYLATGYRGAQHMATRACVELNVTLGDDPIFEVHPADSSALCQRDGDEGSPLVRFDGARTTLFGFYVGSVTQGLTDCRRGTQFLDGYESAAGFASFFREGIAAGKR